MTSTLRQMVPFGDGPWEEEARADGVGVAPAGDVLKQHPEAGAVVTQLLKEPYQMGCGTEGLRIRTDGLHVCFVDRREGSLVHCLRKTGPDEG